MEYHIFILVVLSSHVVGQETKRGDHILIEDRMLLLENTVTRFQGNSVKQCFEKK